MKDQAKVRPRRLRELALHEMEGSVMGEWEGPRIPREEFGIISKENGKNDEAYNLWADLSLLEADITFEQLFEISPKAQKLLKERMPVVRRKRRAKTRIAARMQLPCGARNVKVVQIEAIILDKVVPIVLVDGGSKLNVLTTQMVEKLGLSLVRFSAFIINMINQKVGRRWRRNLMLPTLCFLWCICRDKEGGVALP